MPDYEKMYYTLFNAITDALREAEVLELKKALHILMEAQQRTEQMYIEAGVLDTR